MKFQSTLPARGATTDVLDILHAHVISIHAPREGSDVWQSPKYQESRKISIHAPREGSDSLLCEKEKVKMDFNPRSPRGERQSGAQRFII